MARKRNGLFPAALLMAIFLSACGHGGAGSKAAVSNADTVTEVLEEAVQEQDAAGPEDSAAETPSAAAALPTPETLPEDISSEDADVDLTLLSSTMVYSQVSQMMYQPDDYIGKTVKMKGLFSVYEGETRNYYACVVQDAAACCANGIEFDWAGEHAYPADYPELGTEITVTGTFELYEEDGFFYTQLSNAEVSF